MTECPGQLTTQWTRVPFGEAPLYEVHKLCATCARYRLMPVKTALAAPMRGGECGEWVVEEVVND